MPRDQLANQYIQRLQIPLKPAKIIQQIDERIGPLSTPSKMPCYAWDLSSSICKTGNILRHQEGTPCSKCYANKGHYRFSSVEQANQRRLQGYLNDPDWPLLMAIRLLKQRNNYFRWFSSGDLQSAKMFNDIIQVCLLTSGFIKHWLPTQERAFVKAHEHDIPHNLCVRISSTKLDQVQISTIRNTTNSSISKHAWTCPSHMYNNTCGSCRDCWDTNINLVIYKFH